MGPTLLNDGHYLHVEHSLFEPEALHVRVSSVVSPWTSTLSSGISRYPSVVTLSILKPLYTIFHPMNSLNFGSHCEIEPAHLEEEVPKQRAPPIFLLFLKIVHEQNISITALAILAAFLDAFLSLR